MYPTKTFENYIYLMNRDGNKVHTFKTYDEAAKSWWWLHHNLQIQNDFRPPQLSWAVKWDWKSALKSDNTIHFDYVLRDSYGDVIDVEVLRKHYYTLTRKRSKYSSYPNIRSPGAKFGNGRYYRNIHTTQERRWANAWDCEEYTIRVRSKRSMNNIPNSWDDIHIAAVDICNWKRYRKTQWKP